MFANLSYYLSFSGIMKLIKSPVAGGNVIKLSEKWYLSPVEVKKMIDVFSYLSFRFIGVTFKMIFKKS